MIEVMLPGLSLVRIDNLLIFSPFLLLQVARLINQLFDATDAETKNMVS